MKKIWLSVLIVLGITSYVFIISSVTTTSKAQNTPISKEDGGIQNQDNPSDDFQKSKELTESFDFQQVSSCKSFGETIRMFIQTYKDLNLKANSTEESDSSLENQEPKIIWSNNDILDASVNPWGKDKPDLIQSDGMFIYYANRERNTLAIVQFSGTDPNQTKIIREIPLASGYKSFQLLMREKKLVIIADSFGKTVSVYQSPEEISETDTQSGSLINSGVELASGTMQTKNKYAHIENNEQSVHVLVYDISEAPNLKLERFFDLKGFFLDARVTDGYLYILSKMGINWYASAYQREGVDVDVGDFLPNKREIAIANQTKIQGEWLSDILSDIKCNEVFYNIPNEETLLEYPITPQIITLSRIGLQSPEEETKVKVMFGNIETIYLSPTSLYIQNSLYTNYPFWCKDCFWGATYEAGKNTLLHKFDTQEMFQYKSSAILPGILFGQRSMDEDKDGYLRILTKDPKTNLSTNFIVMTPEMEFYSSLQNIQPEKKYEKVQYIDDKLFLSPQNSGDAKIVIDLQNSHKPKIIGELGLLENPSQLYPYQTISGEIQYILGLGNSRAKQGSGDLKLSLYQIHFLEKETIASKCGHLIIEGVEGGIINSCSDSTKKCSSSQLVYETCANSISPQNIRVDLLDTLSFGGNRGYSEALYDPRTFVLERSGTLLLPVTSQTETINKVCSKIGCIPEKKYETLFDGIKVLQIEPGVGITEIFSKDHQDKFGEEVFPPRLGFLSTFSYIMTTRFAHIVDLVSKTEKELTFGDRINEK